MCKAAWLSQCSNMGVVCITLKLDKIRFNHFNLHVVIVIERYSTSDNLDTICCFFIFQEIRESPINIIQPVSDLRVSRQPAQSASHHPCKRRSHLLLNKDTLSWMLFHITNNSQCCVPMILLWLLHKLRQNMNTIGQFETCEAQINQSSNQATVRL